MNSNNTITFTLLALCATLALATCGTGRQPNIPPLIQSFLLAKSQPKVTLFRFASSGEATLANGVPEMRIEHVVELQGKDVAQVTNALMSRATYTEFHLGCVGADAFGLRLERDDARLELLIDVSCDHVFDAETLSEVGFLSDSGDAFFTALAGKYGLR